ncbi:MAG: hypothetical protein FIA99_15745 [Ruminiclostridium sp.]|nr:hypothetical protein [Ruminiclostridium sp.]
MKKIFILIVGLMLLLSSCDSGKDSKQVQVKESEKAQVVVPFLTYYNNKEGKEVIAKLSYWDLKNNKVNFTDKVVYTTFLNVNSIVEPIMWDGNKKIVSFKNSTPDNEYKNSTKVIKDLRFDTIYGRNIEAKKNLDINRVNKDKSFYPNKDYNLFLNNEDGSIIEKKVAFLFKTKDENSNEIVIGEVDIPSYVDYNNKIGEITFIFKYFFQTHSSLFVAKCNADNIEKINWQEIRLSKEIIAGGGLTPYPSTSVLIGSKYYIQSSLSFAEVDLDKKQSRILDDVSKICRSIVKEGNFVPDYPKDIKPVGIYDDILILNIPVSSDTGMEYLICAFKNNIFLGAIHLRYNDMWSIIDQNKKIIEEINVKDKNLYKEFNLNFLYFPFYGVS